VREGQHELEVTEMDGRRAARVRVSPVEEPVDPVAELRE